MQTTILIDKSLVKDIKKVKDYPRQTYNEIIRRLLDVYILFKDTQIDTANIHTLQNSKMTELWDSKEDEIWDEM